MTNANIILGKLPKFRNIRHTIVKNQDVHDIITAMMKADKLYSKDYDLISQDFYKGTDLATAKNVFNFIKTHFKYKIESDSNQRILSPSAMLNIGRYGIDCKNYALFIYGILSSLKRKNLFHSEIAYRFASYKMFDNIPHHVFVVMIDNGKEYYIDPVLPKFNDRSKTYFHKIDKQNNMALYSVSGLGNYSDMGRVKKKKVAKKVTATKPKTKKRIVLKIALAPARTALLTLVGINFGGLATKMNKALSTHADGLTNLWKNFGGDPNKLLDKVNKGKGKKRIFGLGVIDPVTATAAATAAPLLIKIGEFLKKIGVNPDDIVQVGKTLLAKAVKTETDKVLSEEAIAEEEKQNRIEEVTQSAEGGGIMKNKMLLPLLIGGGLVVYFIAKKK